MGKRNADKDMKEKTMHLSLSIAVLYMVLIVGLILVIAPVIYIFSASVKSQADIFNPKAILIPTEAYFENYANAFRLAPFDRYFVNSLFVASFVTVSNLFFCSLTGFSLAKYRYKGQKAFFVFILATMMFPITVLVVPLYILVNQMGWTDSYAGLTIPFLMSSFGIFLMRQFIKTIPDEYIDAARIDGCSEFTIFLRLVLPLTKPGLAFLAVYMFIENWNSFLWPLVVISRDDLKTLPVGIVAFQTTYYTLYNYIMAMSFLAIVPPLALFFLTRRYYREMIISGLKG